MPKVLLVDDDDALRKALSIRLRAAGFEVIGADHPESAMPLVLHHKPDLLVLDIEMPCYTGLEFHECLKLSIRCQSIPVLYLTGSDSRSHRLRAKAQGACGVINKPYCLDHLIRTMWELCGTTAAPLLVRG